MYAPIPSARLRTQYELDILFETREGPSLTYNFT